MRIADLEVMTVWASVSEADVNKLFLGMGVYFTTIGDTATRYYATVQNILPSYTRENDVILYHVTFDVKNPDRMFFPAMNAQVFFVVAQAKGVLTLPVQVLPEGRRDSVNAPLIVITPNRREEQREVTFGMRTRTTVEVVAGLEEGDTIKTPPRQPRQTKPNPGSMNRPPMGPF
jgi:macrolide-specific efflux system membrane fusion protein